MPEPTRTFFQSMPPLKPAATQAERRQQLLDMAGVMARQCFNTSGEWVLPGFSPDARERIWLCFGLMLGMPEDVALGNAILAETRVRQNTDAPGGRDDVHPFDIFVSNHCVQMLVLHASKLLPPVRKKIEGWARMALGTFPGDRQADLQFHGYNDNMPSKASMGMILGGEYFDDTAAVEQGLWSLRQLRDMLTRRGLYSEFNSPTYLPLTIANLAEIATYAKNEEAKKLAAECAERGWADLLGHYHPPTGMLAGPYTRAYTTDSNGHLSSINFMLWLMFGDSVGVCPLREIRLEPPQLVLHHAGDLYFVVAQKCWLASFEHEPPKYLVDWMNERKYPFTLIATAERGEGGEDSWQASDILATTCQREDFALGTSEGDWGFQADELFLQYRRKSPATGIADIRTGYPKFLFNDDVPGKIVTHEARGFIGESDYLTDHGRYHTLQKDGVALITANPDRRWADKAVTRMGLAFILPEHLSTIEQIDYSDGHVWLHDGLFHMALRPLGATDWGRPAAVQIEKVNRYRMVWLPNYVGPARTFTRKELAGTVNGFVVIAGSDKDETYDLFRRRVTAGKLLDYHSAGSRTLRYQLGSLEVGLCYGTFSGRTRFATINGKMVETPLWQATGLPAERLPFLNEPPALNPRPFPFESMACAAVPDEPTQIFSRWE